MRILIVTYRYAPSSSPRAFRWAAIAEEWARQGHEVTVVASRMPGTEDRETRKGVQIVRTGPAWRAGEGSEGGSIRRPSLARQVLRAIYRLLWRPFQWPDFAAIWGKPAFRTALELGPPNVLITVSHPFTAHMAGLKLKRAWPGVRWVADVGDPFCFLTQSPPNNRLLFGALNVSAERAVMRTADAVSVTCEGAKSEYAVRFPESESKIVVIGPLLADGPVLATTPATGADAPLRCVFAGRFYRDIRNPGPILAMLGALQESAPELKPELHIFGDTSDCAEAFDPLPRGVVLHGFVPHDQALEGLLSGHVLIHIGNANSYQLPSKVVEYVALGRPILNFASTSKGSAAAFFRGFDRTLTIDTTSADYPHSEVDRVRQFLQEAKLNPVAVHDPAKIDAFRPAAIARQYEGLLR